MPDRTGPSKKEEVEVDQIFKKRVPARGLEAAYDDDEPEYTLDMLTALNPDYEGTDKKCGSEKRVPARGLEAAYDDDEPEYTLDMLTTLNPFRRTTQTIVEKIERISQRNERVTDGPGGRSS